MRLNLFLLINYYIESVFAFEVSLNVFQLRSFLSKGYRASQKYAYPLNFSTFCHVTITDENVFWWILCDRPKQSGTLLCSDRKLIHGFQTFLQIKM